MSSNFEFYQISVTVCYHRGWYRMFLMKKKYFCIKIYVRNSISESIAKHGQSRAVTIVDWQPAAM